MGRSLIPHTLTKRPTPSKPLPVKPVPSKPSTSTLSATTSSRMSQFNALTGYDSDSDEDNDVKTNADSPGNFFSLDSSSNLSPPVSAPGLQSEEVSSSKSDTQQSLPLSAPNHISDFHSSLEGTSTSTHKHHMTHSAEPGLGNDVPLDFGNSERLRAWAQSSSYLQPVGPTPSSHDSMHDQEMYPANDQHMLPTNSHYNLAEQHVSN